MRILDKYIIKELLSPFLFGICAFSSVFIGTNTLFKIAQYITKYGASTAAVIKVFIYSLPGIVVYTFPMSMLLAALLSFGRLSGSSEITAMRAGGISFYRLSVPVFIIALLVSMFAIAFNEVVVPRANEAYRNVVRYEIQGNTAPQSQEHIVIKDVRDGNIERLLYARRYDAVSNLMEAVSIQEFQNGNIARVQNAEKARWQNNQWVMYNGTIYDLSAEGSLQRTMKFDQQVMPVDKNPAAIAREQKDASEMTIRELKRHIKLLQNELVKSSSFEIELHQRLSIPLASFVFALIGAPLGLQPQRASSSIGFGLSIIVIFIYYAIMTVTSALGQGGALPVVVAAWIPNLTAFLAGCWLIRRAAQ